MSGLLTPEYASPEQRRGAAPTVAADIYSLGVVLHELLVGVRPSTVAHDDPPLISTVTGAGGDGSRARQQRRKRLRSYLTGDVDAIVTTALRHEPGARYGSAGMLGDDLANHLGHLPVRARPDRWSYRVGRFIQRHQAGVALGAVALIAVLGLSIESLRQARRAERQAEAAAQSADFVVGLLELSYPFDSGGTTPSMRALLDSGAARVATLEQQGIAVPVSLYEVLALGYNGMAALRPRHRPRQPGPRPPRCCRRRRLRPRRDPLAARRGSAARRAPARRRARVSPHRSRRRPAIEAHVRRAWRSCSSPWHAPIAP